MENLDSAIKVKVHNYNRSVHVDSTCLFKNMLGDSYLINRSQQCCSANRGFCKSCDSLFVHQKRSRVTVRKISYNKIKPVLKSCYHCSQLVTYTSRRSTNLCTNFLLVTHIDTICDTLIKKFMVAQEIG